MMFDVKCYMDSEDDLFFFDMSKDARLMAVTIAKAADLKEYANRVYFDSEPTYDDGLTEMYRLTVDKSSDDYDRFLYFLNHVHMIVNSIAKAEDAAVWLAYPHSVRKDW